MNFSFSGPSLSGLLPALAGSLLVGSLYKTIAHTNRWPIIILMIREVADVIFYHFVVALAHTSTPRSRAKIYAITNLTVNIFTVGRLRRYELIGSVGATIFIALIGLEMAFKWADFTMYRETTHV